MGIGREVADAYIDVHGDITKFRESLDDAEQAGREAGIEAADAFGEGFEKRSAAEIGARWNSIMDALHSSADAMDWGRMIDSFDATSLEDAHDKILAFVEEMAAAGKFTDEEFVKANSRIHEQLRLLAETQEASRELAEQRKRDADQMASDLARMADAQRKYKDSFESMFRNSQLKNINSQFKAIAESMASADWSGFAKGYDSLDEARDRLSEVLGEMQALGRITTANADLARSSFKDFVKDEEARRLQIELTADAQEKAAKQAEEAIRRQAEAQERWAKSFEGIREIDAVKRLEQDFRTLAGAVNDVDLTRFAKNFGSFDEMRDRVRDVTDAMVEQGRMSRENADEMAANIQRFIDAEITLREITEATKAEVERAKLEAERFKASLEGMIDAAKKTNLEKDFKNIAEAIATTDWSKVAKGHESMALMRDRITEVSLEMHRMGRISDTELDNISRTLGEIATDADFFNVSFGKAEETVKRTNNESRLLSITIDGITRALQNMGQKVGAMAGLNILTDMFRSGGEFLRNMDRNAVALGKTVTLAGTLVSTVGAAIGGMAVLGQDVANLGAIGLLAPAFLTGAGISIGVLVAAFKDMKTVLKDLGPEFGKLQDQISQKFWDKAERPIRNLVKTLLPTLSTQLQNTATSLGGIFAEIADSITKYANEKTVPVMFERLNKALDRIKDGVEPAVRAFGTLGEVGSRFFERAADAMVGMIEDFDRWVQETAQNGEMERFIERAIQGFKDAGTAASAIVGIFDSIGDAARSAGIGGLGEFADAMVQTEQTIRSSGFQDSMIRLFEGMKGAVENVLTSIGKIGPDIQAAIPTISASLEKIGEIAGKVIEHAGTILSNPKFLDGVTGFVDGIKGAVEKLTPAMGPLGDSLGGLLDLMGRLLPPIADLVNFVILNLGPEFDKMLAAMEPLVQPTADFVKEIIKLAAPVIKTFAETTLPGIVSFVTQLYTPMKNIITVMTPSFAVVLEDIGRGFKNAAEGLKALNGEANNFKAPWDNPPPKPEDWDIDWGKPSDNTFFEDFGNILSKPLGADQGQAMLEAWGDDVVGWFEEAGRKISDGWNRIWSGNIFGDQPGKFFNDFFSGGGLQDFEATVNQWFKDAIFTPLQNGWNDLLGWVGDLFGGGGGGEESGFAGAGMMGKGGKITPEMLGMAAPEENWLQATFDAVMAGITGFFASIGENIGIWAEGVKAGWDEFWGSLPTKIQEVWDGIVLWLQTKWMEITTNISAWWTNLKLGWDTFWGSLPQKVQEAWNAITTWIGTKVAEIQTNINNFITTVRTNWDNFWNTVRAKVQDTWNQVTQWIATKVGEIRTNISNFVSTVQGQWNGFWTTVGTKVSTTWQQIVSWISGKVGEIRGHISGFVSSVRGQWDSFWSGVQQRVSSAWQDMTGAVSRGVESVMGFIRGLPGQISGALGGLGDLLTGAGSAIMDGLRRGIEAGFEAVKGVVGGIAGWIRDNKGPISYDRVLLIPAGEAIMQGLQRGILNEMAPLANTLHTITEQLVDTVVEGFAKSRMYVAGAEAALGFADGLSANSSAVSRSLDALVPMLETSGTFSATGTAGTATLPAAGSKTVIVEKGAVEIHTPTKDPQIVANRVIDDIAALSTL